MKKRKNKTGVMALWVVIALAVSFYARRALTETIAIDDCGMKPGYRVEISRKYYESYGEMWPLGRYYSYQRRVCDQKPSEIRSFMEAYIDRQSPGHEGPGAGRFYLGSGRRDLFRDKVRLYFLPSPMPSLSTGDIWYLDWPEEGRRERLSVYVWKREGKCVVEIVSDYYYTFPLRDLP